MPKQPADRPDFGDEGVMERRSLWARMKALFGFVPRR
jgi:hypothetical protein